MAVKGLTFNKQFFSSESWRLATRKFFGNQDGKMYGLNITTGANNVIIETGYFVICGGLIEIVSPETISAGTSGTKTLCYQIDLSKANTEILFNQGSFVWITGNPTQQDLWGTGTIYQLPLIQVTTNGTTITSSVLKIKDLTDFLLNKDYKPNWTDIENKPSSFQPSTHAHDDRYYTETEINNTLSLYQKKVLSGTSSPSGSTGADGDLYIQY